MDDCTTKQLEIEKVGIFNIVCEFDLEMTLM